MTMANGRLTKRVKISDVVDVVLRCLLCHAKIEESKNSTHVRLKTGTSCSVKEIDNVSVKYTYFPVFTKGWVCASCLSKVPLDQVILDRPDHSKESMLPEHSQFGFGKREPEPDEKINMDWMTHRR